MESDEEIFDSSKIEDNLMSTAAILESARKMAKDVT